MSRIRKDYLCRLLSDLDGGALFFVVLALSADRWGFWAAMSFAIIWAVLGPVGRGMASAVKSAAKPAPPGEEEATMIDGKEVRRCKT